MSFSYNGNSNFPTSRDNFIIKEDFQAGLQEDSQPANSLIRAAHFNHYYAAAYNIEAYLLNNFSFGSPILGTNELNTSFGSEVKLGSITASFTATGLTTSFLATVPSSFGTTPFADPGFSIGHSINVIPNTLGASGLTPHWHNKTEDADIYSDLLSSTYFWCSVEPVSGRVFRYHIDATRLVSNISNFATRIIRNITSTQALRNEVFRPPTDFGGYDADTFHFNSNRILLHSGWISNSSLRDSRWCYMATKLEKARDTSIAVKNIYVDDFMWQNDASYIKARGGLAVRMQGTPNNATCYVLSLGDWTGLESSRRVGRILRLNNVNLNPIGGYAHNSTGWITFTSGASSGTVTDLSGPINFGTSANGTSDIWLRLRVIDSTVDVASSNNGSTWGTIFSTVDSSPITGTGYCGLWSAYLRGQGGTYDTGVYFYSTAPSSFIAENINSSSTEGFSGTARFIFCKVGPDNLITLTNSGSA